MKLDKVDIEEIIEEVYRRDSLMLVVYLNMMTMKTKVSVKKNINCEDKVYW